MKVVTRFAPSPAGFLHIGGARTALFNWLFAKRHGGTFLLRIEDTDRERSTQAAIDAILDGMKWLGLDCDGEPIFQFSRKDRHAEVVKEMLAKGNAYYCFMTPQELDEERKKAQADGKVYKYDGRWRDKDPKDAPAGVNPVVRLKAPREGETVIKDKVSGDVVVKNTELDDMVLLRSDGTPTYMLAVVVDDHDMEVTHVIRGQDHLTNTGRQIQIYNAMGWNVPEFAHVPLIHGADGAKLSKRHGALGVDAYRDMGYLPEALRNYLLRLGWSHGDDEIISTKQAIEWFNVESIGSSPARFDFEKLKNLNGHYIREADNEYLFNLVKPALEKTFGPLGAAEAKIKKAMNALKERAKTITELQESAAFLIKRPPFNEAALKLLNDEGKAIVKELLPVIQGSEINAMEEKFKKFSEEKNIKLGKIAQPIRAALTGSNVSPGGIFDIIDFLGKDEAVARLGNIN